MLGEQLADLLMQHQWVQPEKTDWSSQQTVVYRERLQELGEDYFFRGKQRLAGLILWTQGRARKGLI